MVECNRVARKQKRTNTINNTNKLHHDSDGFQVVHLSHRKDPKSSAAFVISNPFLSSRFWSFSEKSLGKLGTWQRSGTPQFINSQ